MREPFDIMKWSKTIFWIVLAGAVGIVSQMQAVGGEDGFQASDIDFSSGAMALFIWGAIRSSVGFWNQQRPDYAAFKKVLLFLIVCGLSLSLSGCLSLYPAGGDHSRVQSKLHEKIGVDGSSELTITNNIHGEAASERTVNYVGPTEAVAPDGSKYVAAPWQLTDGIVGEVTSPQSVIVAQGQADFLRKIPDSIDGLIKQLDVVEAMVGGGATGPAGGVAARPIVDVLKSLLLQRFLGAVGLAPPSGTGGGSSLDSLLDSLAPPTP